MRQDKEELVGSSAFKVKRGQFLTEAVGGQGCYGIWGVLGLERGDN